MRANAAKQLCSSSFLIILRHSCISSTIPSMPRFWSSPQTVDAFRLSIVSVVFTAAAGIGGCVAFGVSDGAHYESVGYLGYAMC